MKYPYASDNSFYLCGKFIVVKRQCPKCGGNDDGVIDPESGICDKCGFDMRVLEGCKR